VHVRNPNSRNPLSKIRKKWVFFCTPRVNQADSSESAWLALGVHARKIQWMGMEKFALQLTCRILRHGAWQEVNPQHPWIHMNPQIWPSRVPAMQKEECSLFLRACKSTLQISLSKELRNATCHGYVMRSAEPGQCTGGTLSPFPLCEVGQAYNCYKKSTSSRAHAWVST